MHEDNNDMFDEDQEQDGNEFDEANDPKPKGDAATPTAPDEEDSLADTDDAWDSTSKTKPPKGPATKSGMINAMSLKLQGMNKRALTAQYHKLMGEAAQAESEDAAVDVDAELQTIMDEEATLSEDFKKKTAILFDTAVRKRLAEEVARLTAQYEGAMDAAVKEHTDEIVEKVDEYLNYIADKWMSDNEVAVENGLRTEIAEEFMNKVHDAFRDSFVHVPESRVDLVDELSEHVLELEDRLNDTTKRYLETSDQLERIQREAVIREQAGDCSETQLEEIINLTESLDFDDKDEFAERVGFLVNRTEQPGNEFMVEDHDPTGTDEFILEEHRNASEQDIVETVNNLLRAPVKINENEQSN